MSTQHEDQIDATPQSIQFLDEKAKTVVLLLMLSGVFWLLFGSVLAIMASVKMHAPEFLGQWSFLTFGRVRPLHLNTMVYGWASMTGAGVALWLLSRILRIAVPMRPYIVAVTAIWNIALLIGSVEILAGNSRGIEWLEFPVYVMVTIVWCIVVIGIAGMLMLFNRNVETLYVSIWYLIAAFLWFPLLGAVSSLPIFDTPTVQAGMNWWFAHNALGLWFTPIGLAAAYYFIPKVVGRPIHSYGLSLLGFWGLALFYNWNGFHHLIGSPLPTWFVTISVAASVMMIIPVVVVAVNHHLTIVGSFSALKYSPTLRFIVFGAMSYTFVSLQGSIQALRSANEVIHFTHFVIAHAHIGMYAFVTMVLFGSCYYIVPRLTNWEWQSHRLVRWHFWLAAIGILLYTVPLQIGGILQGLSMNNPDASFTDSTILTIPYLIARSVAGVLLTASHLIFAYLMVRIVAKVGLRPAAPMKWEGRPAMKQA